MYKSLIQDEFNETIKIMQTFANNIECIKSIQDSAKIVVNAFKLGKKVLSCGNGGSHCNAMHFSEELTGKYRKKRKGYPAIAISDSSYLSCVGNDFGYENVFSRYIESVGNSNDVLLTISGSGKSINIIKAIEAAYSKGMKIIFLTTENAKNDFSDKVDVNICVPSAVYSDYIQEIHIKIIHVLILIIEKEMEFIS